MYDWRTHCYEAARSFAENNKLLIENQSYGHLEHYHYGGETVCQEIVNYLSIRSQDCVLDAGCGIGGTSRSVHALSGCKVKGVDLRKDFIEFAQKINTDSDIEFVNSNLEEYNFIDYSVWVSLLVFVHISDRVDLFEKLKRGSIDKNRFFLETIISEKENDLFEYPIWTGGELRTVVDGARCEDLSELWSNWTRVRLERFLLRSDFFIELYGAKAVSLRIKLYTSIAEAFANGTLEGRRVCGIECEEYFQKPDLNEECIIEFDQIPDVENLNIWK